MKTETGFAGAWREADAEWGQFPVYEGTETFTNRSGMRMVYVPQAEFKMGGGDWEKCPDGLPVHPVRITKPFWIADVPVTQALFQKFWKEEGEGDADTEQYRGYVLGVSYYEAARFCVWLSKREGVQYRLPTEAEWEYTARHSRELDVDRMCDSHIREWCFDWYAPYTGRRAGGPCGAAFLARLSVCGEGILIIRRVIMKNRWNSGCVVPCRRRIAMTAWGSTLTPSVVISLDFAWSRGIAAGIRGRSDQSCMHGSASGNGQLCSCRAESGKAVFSQEISVPDSAGQRDE